MFDFALQSILSFCEGDYLFISVNKRWREMHLLLFKRPITNIGSCSVRQIRFAIRNGYKLSDKTYKCVVQNGNLRTLQFLWKKKPLYDAQLCAEAAYGGYLRILKWLYAHNCPLDEYTCANAAKKGHLRILKWARRQGCDWNDEHVIQYALDEDNHDMLVWLIRQGCTNEVISKWAAENGYLDLLKEVLHGMRRAWIMKIAVFLLNDIDEGDDEEENELY